MIKKLNAIKKLRKTRKLVAEEELKRLEKDYDSENKNEKIIPEIKKTKVKINQLEKDLENLDNLKRKFSKDS